ncbi:hypothetical protein JCM3770_006397 [Rhodotorula araucariae]
MRFLYQQPENSPVRAVLLAMWEYLDGCRRLVDGENLRGHVERMRDQLEQQKEEWERVRREVREAQGAEHGHGSASRLRARSLTRSSGRRRVEIKTQELKHLEHDLDPKEVLTPIWRKMEEDGHDVQPEGNLFRHSDWKQDERETYRKYYRHMGSKWREDLWRRQRRGQWRALMKEVADLEHKLAGLQGAPSPAPVYHAGRRPASAATPTVLASQRSSSSMPLRVDAGRPSSLGTMYHPVGTSSSRALMPLPEPHMDALAGDAPPGAAKAPPSPHSDAFVPQAAENQRARCCHSVIRLFTGR